MKKLSLNLFKKKWAKVVGLLLLAIIVVFIIRASVFLQSLLIEWIVILFLFGALYFGGKKIIEKVRYRNIGPKIERARSIQLTFREKQVLAGIADGYTNKEIGEQIYISESAVKKHASSIFEKLDAKRRTEAVRIARDAQLIG